MNPFRHSAAMVLLAIATCAFVPAQAADTPTVSQPSVNERLTTAREAIKAKDWRKALAELNVAARQEPRNADVHNLLGYSYRKQAQPNLPKAFEHYKRAIELDPTHKGAHEYIGEAYLMDKKPADAEKHLASLEKICGGKACEEYQDLAKSLEQYKAANK
jgi:Tfp pilus assembly protein PilF